MLYVILLPPLTPPYGADAVSAATTTTSSIGSPSTSAAMAWKTVSVPVMSATAVTTVTLPSELSLQTAEAGSIAPGQ